LTRDTLRPAARTAVLAVLLLSLPRQPFPGEGAPGSGRSPEEAKPAERLDAPARQGARTPEGLDAGESAALRGKGDLVLKVRAAQGDTYVSLGRKYLADLGELPRVRPGHDETPLSAGQVVTIPYLSLNDAYRAKVMRDLFPEDAPRDGDWIHRVGDGRLASAEETLWHLALWYTGLGENFGILADRNGLPDLIPRSGQEIVIPGALLLPAFARLAGGQASISGTGPEVRSDAAATEESADEFIEASPDTEPAPEGPPPPAPPSVPMAEGAEDLTYGSDAAGPYAAYRLKKGEALYSAVVVRYTGRMDAQEVNDLAFAIARRSGIQDVTDIPIAFEVKIPQADLLPEYLPRDDPRRQAWEKHQAEVDRYTNRARSRNLRGVAVILDAGHGGLDRGASHNGVWEHDHVYDILCRIKARLEKETGARVLSTIRDRKEGFAVQETTRLRRSQAEVLLTDPPFTLQSGAASVNLRWYLTNAYFRRLVAEGYDPLKIVFTSLHADARHPSLRGAMVYVPGEEYRRGRYGYAGAIYTRHREVREKRYVSFTRAERERSEGLSRQFARRLTASFRERGVPVHPFLPVRERIIRRGRSWVPAVLRCSEVPVQTLLEVGNLNNPSDSRLLADPAYRQRVADAYVEALRLYYEGAPDPQKAAAGRGR
jgi:N-acetylmuramoyl-L-alanine amidase